MKNATPPNAPNQKVVVDALTPLSTLDAAQALVASYRTLFGREERRALCVALAHSALETGYWGGRR